jgi:anti-anti-sigma factor
MSVVCESTVARRNFRVGEQGDVIVVRLGEDSVCDDLAVNGIIDRLYRVAERADCRRLVVNFAGVTRISSVMLGKLLVLRKKMEAEQRKLTLCQVEPQVQEVFAKTRLDQILDIRDSEADGHRRDASGASSRRD